MAGALEKWADKMNLTVFEPLKFKEYMATGKHFPKAILTCRKAGKEQQEYFKVVMEDAIITGYQSHPSTGGDRSPGDGLKSNSSEGPATTGSANWVYAKPRKRSSRSSRTATLALGRENEPVEMPVRSRVAVNRTRSSPTSPCRSSTTPSGSTASPR